MGAAVAGRGAAYRATSLQGAAPLWGALHVGLASLTWASLVVLSILETANNGALNLGSSEVEWHQQSGSRLPN